MSILFELLVSLGCWVRRWLLRGVFGWASGLVEHLKDGDYFAGELFAFGCEGEVVAGCRGEESGVDGLFKLGDLGGEQSGADAEVLGGVSETGVSGGLKESADALFGGGAGEDGPDAGRERIGSAELGEGVLVG